MFYSTYTLLFLPKISSRLIQPLKIGKSTFILLINLKASINNVYLFNDELNTFIAILAW